MPTITNFDKSTCKVLSQEIEKALQGVAEKYGVKITAGGGSFEAGEFKARVVVKLQGDAAAADEKAKFAQICGIYGLKPEDYGHEFTVAGETYRLTGFDLGRSKNFIRFTRIRDNSPRVANEAWLVHIRASIAKAAQKAA